LPNFHEVPTGAAAERLREDEETHRQRAQERAEQRARDAEALAAVEQRYEGQADPIAINGYRVTADGRVLAPHE
jgi:hypothetical protein